ncbi:hypothetical protein DXB08_24205 [Hungatella hathewayi]|nr:hypothetical protein DXB08_24205 [Hungatella hathewayi]
MIKFTQYGLNRCEHGTLCTKPPQPPNKGQEQHRRARYHLSKKDIDNIHIGAMKIALFPIKEEL